MSSFVEVFSHLARKYAANVSLGSYSALYHTLLHCTGSGCDIRHDL